ncbi:Protein LYK5 [Forsythia ovata]|uniref:Protein LYK5 n=1 Tax=Forsythia ovata TaxID=205694 RepID=A0ABD1W6S3_9LAMI
MSACSLLTLSSSCPSIAHTPVLILGTKHNASYTIKVQGETYLSVVNDTYQALTTYRAIEANNPYDFRNLVVNLRLNVPLWCACPTLNQTAAGFKYPLTYIIKQGDSYSYITDAFFAQFRVKTSP